MQALVQITAATSTRVVWATRSIEVDAVPEAGEAIEIGLPLSRSAVVLRSPSADRHAVIVGVGFEDDRALSEAELDELLAAARAAHWQVGTTGTRA